VEYPDGYFYLERTLALPFWHDHVR
jgi:hypothetical protein